MDGRRHGIRWLAVLLLAGAAGCGSPVNQENFDAIHTGMSREAVIGMLGEPAEWEQSRLGPLSSGKAAWSGGGHRISIQFVNNRVMTKSFGPD